MLKRDKTININDYKDFGRDDLHQVKILEEVCIVLEDGDFRVKSEEAGMFTFQKKVVNRFYLIVIIIIILDVVETDSI